jgi:hypothetical protein
MGWLDKTLQRIGAYKATRLFLENVQVGFHLGVIRSRCSVLKV